MCSPAATQSTPFQTSHGEPSGQWLALDGLPHNDRREPGSRNAACGRALLPHMPAHRVSALLPCECPWIHRQLRWPPKATPINDKND